MISSYIPTRIRRLLQRHALVLMYHRIADTSIDPWQLSVSPEHFDEHLQILTDQFTVVSARQLLDQVKSKSVKDKTICLTFDDGYSDNYYVARPLLEKYNCPATFFIASNFIGRRSEFWWDALASIFLQREQLPQRLEVEIGQQRFVYAFPADEKLAVADRERHIRWHWPDIAPTHRCQVYLEIWEKLRPRPFAEIDAVIQFLSNWAGYVYDSQSLAHAMEASQLEELQKHPLIDIGVHTHTHPALASHDERFQKEELAQCQKILETGGVQTHLVAYPYGNHNDQTVTVVRSLGFKGAFTTAETTVQDGSDKFRLGRFQVNNWNGKEFSQHVKKWLN